MKYTAGTVVELRYPLITKENTYSAGTEGVVTTYSEFDGEVSYQLYLRCGTRISVVESCLRIASVKKEEPEPKAEELLFVEKCSGFQFHGRVICESKQFMIVEKDTGISKEIAINKSMYKIFKEVK